MEIKINTKIEVSDEDILVCFGRALSYEDITYFYYNIAHDLEIKLEYITKNSKKEIKDRLMVLLNNELIKLDYDEEISN